MVEWPFSRNGLNVPFFGLYLYFFGLEKIPILHKIIQTWPNFMIFSTVFWRLETLPYVWKNIREMNVCVWKLYIFTKYSRIVCLMNPHLLTASYGMFCFLPNFHRLCVSLIYIFWLIGFSDVFVGYEMHSNWIVFFFGIFDVWNVRFSSNFLELCVKIVYTIVL